MVEYKRHIPAGTIQTLCGLNYWQGKGMRMLPLVQHGNPNEATCKNCLENTIKRSEWVAKQPLLTGETLATIIKINPEWLKENIRYWDLEIPNPPDVTDEAAIRAVELLTRAPVTIDVQNSGLFCATVKYRGEGRGWSGIAKGYCALAAYLVASIEHTGASGHSHFIYLVQR